MCDRDPIINIHFLSASKISIALVFAYVLVAAGCASGAKVSDYPSLSVDELCILWRHDDQALRELKMRAGFSEKEWKAIGDRKIFVGMSQQALHCSRGKIQFDGFFSVFLQIPIDAADIEGTIWTESGEWGERTIYRYELRSTPSEWKGPDVRPYDKIIWVFMENGKIVNYGHGEAEYIYDYEPTRWEEVFSWKLDWWDFSRLRPPPKDAWYAIDGNED